MKKLNLILITSVVLFIIIIVAYYSKESMNLQLTKEEKEFIAINKDSIFFMGYYDTPSEELIINKLCEKLSYDTGLNIVPFEETWNHNLELLESGEIAMLANMNTTEDRLKYALFSNSLESLNVGIYSRYDNKINSYTDLSGKTIGIEKGVYLLDEFKLKYPDIQLNERYYNSLEELKIALSDNEIDGFMSSESYSENLNFFYFFNIKSLSVDNNHIGIHKEYRILYNIISKEIDYLMTIGWDKEVRDLVSFDIETKLMELTDKEKSFIEEKGTIRVGLPRDYIYYSYGDENNPRGIIPTILKKIEFLTGLDFIYVYDSYDNLINRSDIDIFISSDRLSFLSTAPIFSTDIIAVSNEKQESIDSIYDLEPYTLGVINNTVLLKQIKKMMPYLDMNIYTDYNKLLNALEQKNVDYIIVPEIIYEKMPLKSELVNNGVINTNFHYFYSKDSSKTLIVIINKCLSRINTHTIIRQEVAKLIDASNNYEWLFLLLFGVIVIFIIIIRYIIRLKNNINNLLYLDQETLMYNEMWLKTKLKINLSEHIYFLTSPIKLDLILERYGENAYKKAQKNMLMSLNEAIGKHEYIIKLLNNCYLLIKKPMTDEQRMIFMHQLKNLFYKKLTIFDINYNYEMNVVGLKPEDELYSYDKLLKELDIGLQYSKHIGDVVDYTYDVYSKHQSKIDFDTRLSSAIINEEVSITLNKIYNYNDEFWGYDCTYTCHLGDLGEVSYINLKRSIVRLGLETIFDKIILKQLFHLIDEQTDMNMNFFTEINKKTLFSQNFFSWLEEKMALLKKAKLHIKLDIDTYEMLMESSTYKENSQIEFVIIDFDNLVDSTVIKDYDIQFVELNASLFADIERNKDIIDFAISFCKKYNKKIIVRSVSTKHQFLSIKDFKIDYYIDNFRRDNDESINR